MHRTEIKLCRWLDGWLVKFALFSVNCLVSVLEQMNRCPGQHWLTPVHPRSPGASRGSRSVPSLRTGPEFRGQADLDVVTCARKAHASFLNVAQNEETVCVSP